MSGYDNYPDGTWAGDPGAPWNEPEVEGPVWEPDWEDEEVDGDGADQN